MNHSAKTQEFTTEDAQAILSGEKTEPLVKIG